MLADNYILTGIKHLVGLNFYLILGHYPKSHDTNQNQIIGTVSTETTGIISPKSLAQNEPK